MASDQHEHFFAMIDGHIFSLVERLNATITHLAHVVQQQGETALSGYLSSLLQAHGFILHNVVGSDSLAFRNSSSENAPTLVLLSRCPPQQDTFARWGTLVTRLLTFAFYHELTGNLPVNVTWLIDTTKESRTRSFPREQDLIIQGNGCLYDLPTSPLGPMLALGTKGLLSVDMEVRTTSSIYPSTDGAILPNAAWRLVWALQSLKNAQEEILIDGFYDALAPLEDEEIAFLRTISTDEQRLKQELQVDDFLLHLQGFQLRYTYSLLPTCTITSMHSGSNMLENRHTLPSSATASLDLHLVPLQEPHDIYKKLRHHLDEQGFEDVQTTMRASERPQHTSLHDPFTELVLNTTHTIYNEQVSLLPLLPQIASTVTLQAAIPILYAQFGTLPYASAVNGTASTVKEATVQQQFLTDGMKFLALIMRGMVERH